MGTGEFYARSMWACDELAILCSNVWTCVTYLARRKRHLLGLQRKRLRWLNVQSNALEVTKGMLSGLDTFFRHNSKVNLLLEKWKLKNEPTYLLLPNLGNKFWPLLESNFYAKMLTWKRCVQKQFNWQKWPCNNDFPSSRGRVSTILVLTVNRSATLEYQESCGVYMYYAAIETTILDSSSGLWKIFWYAWRRTPQINEFISISSYDTALQFGK